MKQSALHPHRISAARVAQIEKWRLLGAQARRGQHIAKRTAFQNKRAKRGTSVLKGYAKATAWGVQKMVVPIGGGGPLVAQAKNRIPGYNAMQISKSSGRRALHGKHKGRLG